MPQLVGLNCSVCKGRIGSDIDGRFCDACGNPLHDRCSKLPPGAATNDELLGVATSAECPRCGCNPHTRIAVDVRGGWLSRRAVAERAPLVAAARTHETWRRATVLCTGIGTIILGFGLLHVYLPPGEDGPNAAEERKIFGRIGLTVGAILTVGSLLFGWLRTRAAQHYHHVLEGEEEVNEPPG